MRRPDHWLLVLRIEHGLGDVFARDFLFLGLLLLDPLVHLLASLVPFLSHFVLPPQPRGLW
jgi:hypothetical protein